MNTPYIHEDFLLDGETAKILYHNYAANCPIIDYHNHLPVNEIAENRQFANLSEIWLEGDHYKWRLMRANGVKEKEITGTASPWEKFQAWAATVPATLGNPLYPWTHMELAKPFGISDQLLNAGTAAAIWDHCNDRLQQPGFSARGLIESWGVKLLCTTDDPADDLAAHARLAADPEFAPVILSTFRPDRAMAIENAPLFLKFIRELSASADVDIETYSDFITALKVRHDAFHRAGCRLADHGLSIFCADDFSESQVTNIFLKARKGESISIDEIRQFKSALLYQFGVWAHERDWIQQYHIGAIRNTRSRLMQSVGPDAGGDSIDNQLTAQSVARALDRLDATNNLPRTIIYSLNPNDLEMLAALAGCFQDGESVGKVQLGAPWWFNDHEAGMLRHFTALSNIGLLSRFIGMLTDSRSFLSFSRHDYFRRVLSSYLGEQVDSGRLPNDISLIGSMVTDICYRNVRSYLGFESSTPDI